MITANHCDTYNSLTMCLGTRNIAKVLLLFWLGRLIRVGCLTAKRILGVISIIPFAE